MAPHHPVLATHAIFLPHCLIMRAARYGGLYPRTRTFRVEDTSLDGTLPRRAARTRGLPKQLASAHAALTRTRSAPLQLTQVATRCTGAHPSGASNCRAGRATRLADITFPRTARTEGTAAYFAVPLLPEPGRFAVFGTTACD